MIRATPITDRLKAAGFKHAEGILELATQTEPPRISPALFVMPEREAGQPNRLGTGVMDQKVVETFAVAIVVEGARLQGKVGEDLAEHTRAVEDALIGWTHPDASGPCEFAGSRLVGVDRGKVTWAVFFTASRHIRKSRE